MTATYGGPRGEDPGGAKLRYGHGRVEGQQPDPGKPFGDARGGREAARVGHDHLDVWALALERLETSGEIRPAADGSDDDR